MKEVEPSVLTTDERNELQELHGLCWNTDDDFDEDYEDQPEVLEIIEFHRSTGEPHWYLPFHETLSREGYSTELKAYLAAGALSTGIN